MKAGDIVRNKITIDVEKECGYDCECIVSEADGSNTLELYLWNVGSNPSIEISWTEGGGSGDESRYDVNGDGEITQADAEEILQAAVNGVYDYKYDLDLDGYVTAKDALLVAKKVAGIEEPEEGGSATVEGVFLDNGDYYYSIPIGYLSGYRTVTVKVKCDDFESKPIYFNCLNIDGTTDFIVTRNLSYDDTYTVAAASDDNVLPIATTQTTGVIKVGAGLNIDADGTLSVINIGSGSTIVDHNVVLGDVVTNDTHTALIEEG